MPEDLPYFPNCRSRRPLRRRAFGTRFLISDTPRNPRRSDRPSSLSSAFRRKFRYRRTLVRKRTRTRIRRPFREFPAACANVRKRRPKRCPRFVPWRPWLAKRLLPRSSKTPLSYIAVREKVLFGWRPEISVRSFAFRGLPRAFSRRSFFRNPGVRTRRRGFFSRISRFRTVRNSRGRGRLFPRSLRGRTR